MARGERFSLAALGALVLLVSQATAPDQTGSYLGSTNCGPDLTVSICIANNYTHTVYADTAMRSDIKSERAVYFLRHNSVTAQLAGRPLGEQKAEEQYWHVVNSEGVLREFGGRARPVNSHSQFVQALDGLPFDAVLGELRLVAQAPPDVD